MKKLLTLFSIIFVILSLSLSINAAEIFGSNGDDIINGTSENDFLILYI